MYPVDIDLANKSLLALLLNGAHFANALAIPLCEYNCADELTIRSPRFSTDQNRPFAESDVVGLNLPMMFSNVFMDFAKPPLSEFPVNNPSRDFTKEGIAVKNPPTAFAHPHAAPIGVK